MLKIPNTCGSLQCRECCTSSLNAAMEKRLLGKIFISGLMAVLIGTSIYFGIPFYHSRQNEKKIAAITPSFRGARNMYITKLNRENAGKHFFSIDDYRIRHRTDGPYAYVSDLPVYVKGGDGKTQGFISHWGYNEKHLNWELIWVGRLSEEKRTKNQTKENSVIR